MAKLKHDTRKEYEVIDSGADKKWAEIPEGFRSEPFKTSGGDIWCGFRLGDDKEPLLVGVMQNGEEGYVPVGHDVLYELVTGTDDAYNDLIECLGVGDAAKLYDASAMADAIPEDADMGYWIDHGVVCTVA